MAFDKSNMVLWSDGNNKKLYHYNSSDDTLATIKGAGYFNTYSDQLAVDDIVVIQGSDGFAIQRASAVSSGSVTMANLSGQATLTDSTTGTPGGAIADVGASFNQATLNNNFASLTTKVNAILQALGS